MLSLSPRLPCYCTNEQYSRGAGSLSRPPQRERCQGSRLLLPALAHTDTISKLGVLSTSNRKPPLRIPLRRVAEILTHPGQVEVVSPKRVNVLANERSDVAQRFVSNLVALGT